MIISTDNKDEWEVVAAPVRMGKADAKNKAPEADMEGCGQEPQGNLGGQILDCGELIRGEDGEDWIELTPEPFGGIETEHCYLRELGPDDIEALFRLYSYPGITEFIEPLYGREEEIRYRQQYIDNIYHVYGFGIWGVYLKSTGELIGQNGIEYREDFTWDTADLGYVISPEHRRKGYCEETTIAVLDYARDHTWLDYVQARIRDANRASIHIRTGLGFIPTHRFSDDERVYVKPLHGGAVEDTLSWREFRRIML
ncbi:MAG: GNAT family N-acetyltransferase [Lachnospiraceae bacterium]|nr:GNAT family N-acetyltransferase [Lachnospiraceae bacterium]